MNGVALIQDHRAEVEMLCRRFAVTRLCLFGSALTDRWDPESSDLDFLVEYGPGYQELPPFERLVGLQMALEDLFHRKVDVVNLALARNPYFVENALSRCREIYEGERIERIHLGN
ncbi:MAG: nucleotidyltransferase family protein [Fimbriimonas sp.]